MTSVTRERLVNAFITTCIGTCFVILGVWVATYKSNAYTEWYVNKSTENTYKELVRKLDRMVVGIDSLNANFTKYNGLTNK